MIVPLTYVVIGLSAVLCVAAIWYAARDRLIDDRILVVAGLVELGLLVLLVGGLLGLDHIDDTGEKATFVAYVVSLPVIPAGTAFLAIKEKSRWAMGSIAVGAFAVSVMSARLLQIWTAYG